MRRLFWLALGVTLGALIMRKISRVAQKLTPQGMAQSVGASLSDLGDALRDFADDVREAMGQRERELRASVAAEGELGQVTTTGPGEEPDAHR